MPSRVPGVEAKARSGWTSNLLETITTGNSLRELILSPDDGAPYQFCHHHTIPPKPQASWHRASRQTHPSQPLSVFNNPLNRSSNTSGVSSACNNLSSAFDHQLRILPLVIVCRRQRYQQRRLQRSSTPCSPRQHQIGCGMLLRISFRNAVTVLRRIDPPRA